MEYEFRFVVKGATVDDADIVDLLADTFDAMLFRGAGVDLLDVSGEGRDALDAAVSAVRAIRSTVPQLQLLYLDRDLVGIPEIAERTNATRQAVSLWANGSRRNEAQPFPAPEGVAGRAKVWLWAEVDAWLAFHGLDDGINRPTREEIADIDSALHCGIHLKSSISVERWRRTRRMGTASYVYSTSIVTSFQEETTVDSPQGWSAPQTLDELAGAR
ncbi:hypothetical protein GCM10022254_40180 [Actinomadura meridiana]|uniref:DNA-binding protein n=1 Tax=Actinomadura meridiana TaxID=559626 RepID=A0ABP8C6Q5_9ACTN